MYDMCSLLIPWLSIIFVLGFFQLERKVLTPKREKNVCLHCLSAPEYYLPFTIYAMNKPIWTDLILLNCHSLTQIYRSFCFVPSHHLWCLAEITKVQLVSTVRKCQILIRVTLKQTDAECSKWEKFVKVWNNILQSFYYKFGLVYSLRHNIRLH